MVMSFTFSVNGWNELYSLPDKWLQHFFWWNILYDLCPASWCFLWYEESLCF